MPAAERAADHVGAVREDVVRASVAALYRRHPEWDARWGERGRALTTRDCGYHLEFLEAALRTGEPAVFTRYSAWLARVLASNGVPVEAAEANYDVVLAELAALITPADFGDVEALMRAGRRALREQAPVPGLRDIVPAAEVPDLVDALLRGESRRVQELIASVVRRGSLAQAADTLVQPAMAEVGRLWQEGRVSVAQEHLATALLQTALARVFGEGVSGASGGGRRALFACIEGNHHALGLRLAADTFEAVGWEVRYLGGDVPTRDLVSACRAWSPDLVALSVSLPQHVAVARRTIETLRREWEGTRRIVVGGIPLNDFPALVTVVGADAAFPDLATLMRASA